MEARVIRAFGDKDDSNRLYVPGDVYEADEARVAELQAGGFVKAAEAPRKSARRRAAKPKE